jgi:hypothetical protein
VSIVIFREHHLSLSRPLLQLAADAKRAVVRKNIKNGPLSWSLRKQGALFFAWVFIIDLNKNAHLLACLLKVAL